ncbi:hypothetical protein QR680_007233 [Steinernema hermaphroditum]|uniref:Protein UBASH3A-like protein n=1 Tax=Steinernema hermaphroditum TaxID=289476 RepID=A0AA39LYH0_9BILA|nr:hypothetical protein QR680_007233 [Steinernema hermaphroditum]
MSSATTSQKNASKTKKKVGPNMSLPLRPALMPLSSRIDDERSTAKRIYLVRNGECCDRLMPCWRMRAFAEHNTYRLIDLNQPLRVPIRAGAPDAFLNDSPLTQTAEYMISMMNLKKTPRIYVEPGLFEPLMFYWQDRIPLFMTNQELINAGFHVDDEYVPVISMDALRKKLFEEKHPDDSFNRITAVADSIVECANERSGGVLVVTHAPSVDLLLRRITGRSDSPRTIGDLYRMGLNYPFGSSAVLEYEQPSVTKKAKPKWVYKPGALPPLTCAQASTMVEVPDFS